MAPITIRFSQTAEQTFRSLPRREQQVIANWLERTSRENPPAQHASDTKTGSTKIIRVGNRVLTCVNTTPVTIVIASIEELREPPTSILRRWSRTALRRPLTVTANTRSSGGTSTVHTLLTDFIGDIRFGLRMIRRNPGFAIAVIFTLAVGLGGNAAVVGVVNNMYFSDMPFANGEELLRLRDYSLGPSGDIRPINMTSLNFLAIRAQNAVFTDVVAQQGHSYTYSGGDTPSRLSGIMVSENWTATLGVRPMLGRSFVRDEEILGPASGVVLVSHAFWQQELGATLDVTSQSIVLNGIGHRIIGVMPPRFHYPYSANIWSGLAQRLM